MSRTNEHHWQQLPRVVRGRLLVSSLTKELESMILLVMWVNSVLYLWIAMLYPGTPHILIGRYYSTALGSKALTHWSGATTGWKKSWTQLEKQGLIFGSIDTIIISIRVLSRICRNFRGGGEEVHIAHKIPILKHVTQGRIQGLKKGGGHQGVCALCAHRFFKYC